MHMFISGNVFDLSLASIFKILFRTIVHACRSTVPTFDIVFILMFNLQSATKSE